jgi:predicted DCC family thiol-disulfide oxidoreductase YuxK
MATTGRYPAFPERRSGYCGGVLIYDGDCAFCARSLGLARRLGATEPAQPWQALDLDAYDLTEADVTEAAWFIAEGVRARGHEAVARMLQSSTHASVRLVGRVVGSRLLRPIASRAYAWVAAHRHELPGGTAACAIDKGAA